MAPEMSIHRFSHITTFLWLFMDRVISDNFKNVVGCFHQIYFIISDVTCFYGSSQTNLLYCGNFIDKNHVVIFTRPFEIRRREGKRGPHGYWEITQMGPAPSPLWNWRDVFMENNTFLLSRSRCAQLDDWLQSTHGNLEFSTMCTLLTLPLCELLSFHCSMRPRALVFHFVYFAAPFHVRQQYCLRSLRQHKKKSESTKKMYSARQLINF